MQESSHALDELFMGMASQITEREDNIITPDLRGASQSCSHLLSARHRNENSYNQRIAATVVARPVVGCLKW